MIEQQTVKSFFFNILNGMALGIVIALIPGALLGEVFKFLARYSDVFTTLGSFLTMFSIGASLIIGVLAGMNLKFNAADGDFSRCGIYRIRCVKGDT